MERGVFKSRQLHTMLDIETYSAESNAAIAQISAVDFYVSEEFNLESQFTANINQKSNQAINRHYSEETLNWWKDRPIEVKKSLMTDQRNIDDVIKDFIKWLSPKSLIWCQGASFDIPIIKSTLSALNIETPWKYWNERDSRTLFKTLDVDMQANRSESAHNSLVDCMDQARVLNHLLFQIDKATL